MITFFSIPKPFKGHIDIIQRNAIQSWLALSPKCTVILFGDEIGLAEVAKEFDILHIKEIKKNKYGTPLLNSAFDLAQKLAKTPILTYINADIILLSDFISGIQKINKDSFLMCGRRWNFNIKEIIDFNDIYWESKLYERVIKEGELRTFSGIDYFVFPVNLQYNLPQFAVGRLGWDNWLLYHARTLKIPIIDATKVITAIHQNHDYLNYLYGKREKITRLEDKENIKLTSNYSDMLTLREADWVLTDNGLEKPRISRRVFSALSSFYVWRKILSIRRKIKKLHNL